MATVLQVIQEAAKRCGITNTISSVIGNTNNNVAQLLTFLQAAGKDLRDSFNWPELEKEHTFDLVSGTPAYALPSDFDGQIFETLWNRDQMWPLFGPMTPEQWQFRKSGIANATILNEFRVKGYTDTQFYIHPTPSASGDTLVFEYYTKTWIRPKTWTASTTWTGIQYCFYNGNIYDRGGTGAASTGTTPPTHTTGSSSDGSISWTYTLSPYENFVHDSDVLILDDEILTEQTVWRWKREKGFDYQELKKENEAQINQQISKLRGASAINWRMRRGDFWSYYPITPDGNWPTS